MLKKWLLISLFAFIFLPVLAIAVLLVFLNTADLTQHRDFIAENISKVAGRGLSLNGELTLDLSSSASIVVTDIVLANAAWASTSEMISIDRFEASIELLPLLDGDIHIPRFRLQGLKASLETNATGSGNWVLAEPADEFAVDDDSDAPGEINLPWIGDMEISDVAFSYRNVQTGKDVAASLDHVRLGAETLVSPTLIDIAGQVNNNPVEINGKLVLPSVFSTDYVDVPVELHVKALGLTAEAAGSVTGSSQAPAVNLDLHASAADLKQLQQVFGDVVPEVKPVELVMELKGDQGQPVTFKLNATAGKAKLATELTLLRQAAVPDISGVVDFQDIDVVALWGPLLNDKPGGKKSVKANTSAHESEHEPVQQPVRQPAKKPVQKAGQKIPLAWLRAFDANVTLSAKRINLPQAKIKSLQSRFIVKDRRLNIDEWILETDAGTVMADLVMNAQGKQPALQLKLNTTPLKLSRLKPLSANKRFTGSQAEAAILLTAKGDTVAGLIESLQGSIELDYDNQKRKEKLSLNLAREAENKTSGKANLVLVADGRIEGETVELRGNITPPTGGFLLGQKAYEIDLVLQVFGVSSKISGQIADVQTLDGLDLGIEARAPNMDRLRRSFGEAVPVLGKVDLTAHITAKQRKIKLSKLAVLLDEGRIDGELALDAAADIPGIQAEISLTDLDLDKLLPAEKKTAGAKQEAGRKPEKQKLFSDEPLPFEKLSMANARINLQANNLKRGNEILKELEMNVNLQDGKLSASLVKHSAFHGELDNALVIDASGKGEPTVNIKFKAPHLELSELVTVSDGSAAVEGPLAIDISLQGRGHSMASIMGSLDGDVYLLMEEGGANAKAIDMFVGGLTAVVGTMFTEQASKTQINCAICDLKFQDGMLKPQLVVLDTQYSTVFAEGQVDLKKEQLDVKVSPQAKGVTLSVAYPVRLHGRLSKPGVELEKTGAILKTGQLWANIVYPPSLLLKFSDLAGGKNNPCVSMVADNAGIPIISDVGEAVGSVVEGAGDIVEGAGGVVEGTFKGISSGIENIFDIETQEDDEKASSEIVIDDDDFGMDD